MFIASCGGSGGGAGGGTTGGSQNIKTFVGVPSGVLDASMVASALYQQVGTGDTGGIGFSVGLVYHGTPASATVLSPTGYTQIELFATDGAHQVGQGIKGFGSSEPFPYHALMFSGTSASLVDLHPAGSFSSTAVDIQGGLEVGHGQLIANGPNHPLLWKGTAASVVDLLPTGAIGGGADAVLNGVEAGHVTLTSGNNSHAAIWHGTAASFQDLNPAGFASSFIRGMSVSDMVGWGAPGSSANNPEHALRWVNGVATDLNPANIFASRALATDGKIQVGLYRENSSDLVGRACYWTGKANTFIDLNALLPPPYVNSEAWAIDGKFICGIAFDAHETPVAVMWKLP